MLFYLRSPKTQRMYILKAKTSTCFVTLFNKCSSYSCRKSWKMLVFLYGVFKEFIIKVNSLTEQLIVLECTVAANKVATECMY